MADPTYGPKVYHKQGGDILVVASGGELLVESGGTVTGLSAYTIQTALADITDNSGGATADGTIGAVTAPTALTDNGGGTADATVQSQPTFAASVAWNGSSVYPSAADEAAITAVALAARNNMKELTTRQAENRLAIIALTDAVKEISTKLNALLAKLRTGGAIEA